MSEASGTSSSTTGTGDPQEDAGGSEQTLGGTPEAREAIEALVAAAGGWLSVPEVGERLHLEVTRVRQLVRDRQVLAVRRAPGEPLRIPAAFFQGHLVVKGLPGLLTLLLDDGFTDAEALRWLFTADDTLPGTPVAALAADRKREVRRRAQALAF